MMTSDSHVDDIAAHGGNLELLQLNSRTSCPE